MIYPRNFEQKIGFDHIRTYLKGYCQSTLGKDVVDEMAFMSDVAAISTRLGETVEMLAIINGGVELPLNYMADINSQLNGVRVEGTYLTADELYSLYRSLATMTDIARFFGTEDASLQYPLLKASVANLQLFPELTAAISGIIDKFGNIRDNASPQLLELRRSIANTTSSINGMLRRILVSAREAGYVDKDVAPSVRDGRLVIPVSPMYKRKIRGIVHDESATGKTVFIEPAEIVEANNTIRELESEIRREIIRILTAVTSTIRPHIDELIWAYSVLGNLDFIRAKARFSIEMEANMPVVESTPELEWYHAVHPVLSKALAEQGKSVVPLNVTLNQGNRILLISGPNAGGKSVCLKTVGVNQYMLQCGVLPLVHSNSHFGVFENLFIDIGDEQSIEDDLSTYSSHLNNMKCFINNSNARTLILIDEFGSGTEPQIGGALAQAILRNLNDKGVFGVITTHYQNLKHFADDTQGIVNGAMLYDRQNMRPLFQLSVGYPGSSFAIEIANKIGLPREVIDEAKEIVGSDYVNLDKYILDITRDRKYWENKRHNIRIKEKRLTELLDRYDEAVSSLSAERRDIIKTAKAEASDILSSANSAIERTIHDIKKANAERERTKDLRRQLDDFRHKLQTEEFGESDEKLQKLQSRQRRKHEKQKQKAEPKPADAIKVGDTVTIDGSNSVGEVLEVEGKQATVTFGIMKSKVDVSRLTKTLRKASRNIERKPVAVSEESRSRQLNFSPDIDVRGMKVDEALQAVTYFLDDATQFSISRVRILHGTGNGILRQYIREFLNTYPGVKSYRDEHVQFGGAGITVVDLS